MNTKNTKIKGKKNQENLIHFNCGVCEKWWSISDAPENRKNWFCPWCGIKQEI